MSGLGLKLKFWYISSLSKERQGHGLKKESLCEGLSVCRSAVKYGFKIKL